MTRGAGLAIDAVIVTILFLVGAGLAEILGSLVGGLRPPWLAWILAVAGGLVLYGGYFAGFWSTTGQTPGMRLMRGRVRDRRNRRPIRPRTRCDWEGWCSRSSPASPASSRPSPTAGGGHFRTSIAGTVVVYDGDGSGLPSRGLGATPRGAAPRGRPACPGTSGTGPQ